MSKNRKHQLAQIQVPILNHPYGRKLCSMLRAMDIEREGRGCLIDGVLHWYHVTTESSGYYGPTRGEWRHRKSGEAGPIVLQLEQGR